MNQGKITRYSKFLEVQRNFFCQKGAVADLGEDGGGDRPSLHEKIFDFFQQKRTKMNFYHLERFLKNDCCRSSPLPSKILDPPLKSRHWTSTSTVSTSKTTRYLTNVLWTFTQVQLLKYICTKYRYSVQMYLSTSAKY